MSPTTLLYKLCFVHSFLLFFIPNLLFLAMHNIDTIQLHAFHYTFKSKCSNINTKRDSMESKQCKKNILGLLKLIQASLYKTFTTLVIIISR